MPKHLKAQLATRDAGKPRDPVVTYRLLEPADTVIIDKLPRPINALAELRRVSAGGKSQAKRYANPSHHSQNPVRSKPKSSQEVIGETRQIFTW
jgi:hypothetical protein